MLLGLHDDFLSIVINSGCMEAMCATQPSPCFYLLASLGLGLLACLERDALKALCLQGCLLCRQKFYFFPQPHEICIGCREQEGMLKLFTQQMHLVCILYMSWTTYGNPIHQLTSVFAG